MDKVDSKVDSKRDSEIDPQSAPLSKSEPACRSIPPYRTLDAWRGFASLWVVMFHISEILVQRTPALANSPLYLFGLQGGLGVQLFFVISGYCIVSAACSPPRDDQARGVQTLRRFLWARVRRIYPPFWWALLLTILSSLLAQRLVARGILRESVAAGKLPHDPLYYLSNGLLSQIAVGRTCLLGPSWSLCYEVAFYLIVGLMLSVVARSTVGIPAERASSQARILAGCHLITVPVMVALLAIPEHLFYPFDLWLPFGMGALVYDFVRQNHSYGNKSAFKTVESHQQQYGDDPTANEQRQMREPKSGATSTPVGEPMGESNREITENSVTNSINNSINNSMENSEKETGGINTKLTLGLLAIGVLAFWVRYAAPVGYLGNGGRWPFLVALLFSLVLIIAHRHDARIVTLWPIRILSWVGKFSYSLYLTHVLVIGPTTQLLRRLHLPKGGDLIVLCGVMLVSVLFARLFYQFCERPFLRSRRMV